MKNAMTIDVEDYFQVSAFEDKFDSRKWDDIVPRVEVNTNRLLDLFAESDVNATFFVLGWVAERFPALIKRIANEGHEVASHGTMHQRATDQTQEEFRKDISTSKKILENIIGKPIIGYRAPSFSFSKHNEWVYDILQDEGYKYSSSVYPVIHDHYGIPDAPRFRYTTPSGIDEIPLSTLKLRGKNIPISGGGYFRLYPYLLTKLAVQSFCLGEKQPYIFYLHPWEIDPGQPRVRGVSAKTKFRHYLNLKHVEGRLERLLGDFNWSGMGSLYGYID